MRTMMVRILFLLGSGVVGFLVHLTTAIITQSPLLATLAVGVCATSLGIAAARDGLWAVDKDEKRD